jgi:membrane associated rhomboid family serine protease
MLPYKDENPTFLTPYVTVAIIAANLFVWVFVQTMGDGTEFYRSLCQLSLIPGEFLGRIPSGSALPGFQGLRCIAGGGPVWITPISSMFLHGSWMHILGNMWFLWVFGNNIEDSMGHGRYLVFYLLSGLAGAMAQVFANPDSSAPMVGASGAISGIMGAYIVLYPRVRVRMFTLLVFYPLFFSISAFFVLGYWFLLQLLGAGLADQTGGGVAFMAHVGGFLFGALGIGLFKNPEMVARHRGGVILSG